MVVAEGLSRVTFSRVTTDGATPRGKASARSSVVTPKMRSDSKRTEPRPGRGFRVPGGRALDGSIVPPEDSVRGQDYGCPSCGSQLVVRGGSETRVRRHFAHPRSTACSAESVKHLMGKEIARLAIERAMGGHALTLEIRCNSCSSPFGVPFPTCDAVALEYTESSGRIVDVMALEGSLPAVAVEVLVTHAVDEAKAGELRAPWLEVSADDLLTDPMRWRVGQHRLKTKTCENCRTIAQCRAELLSQHEIELDASYRADVTLCGSCRAPTLFFSWDSTSAGAAPPDPRPRGLRNIWTLAARAYGWWNTCLECEDMLHFSALRAEDYQHLPPLRE